MVSALLLVVLTVGSAGPVKFTQQTETKLRKGWWSSTVTRPHFQDSGPVATFANHSLTVWAKNQLAGWLNEDVKGMNDMEKPTEPYEIEITPSVVAAQPELISLDMQVYSYTGGAHPNTNYLTFNYGLVRGRAKLLTLTDLFRRWTKPLGIISKFVIAKLKEDKASWVVEGTTTALTKMQGDEFVITRKGLLYIFSPYEMGSYAEGKYTVEVPFAGIRKYLDPGGPLKGFLAGG